MKIHCHGCLVKGIVWCGVERAQKVVLCILYCHRYMEVSWNGWYPQLIHLNRIFHCKTIQLLGYPPFMETRTCSLRIGTAITTLAISVPSSGSTPKAASGWARSPIDLLGPNGPLLDSNLLELWTCCWFPKPPALPHIYTFLCNDQQ